MAGGGILALLMIFGHVGKTYDVVLDADKTNAVAATILIVLGVVLLAIALLLPLGASAADGPPPSWNRATVSTCAPYNPSSCQSKTVWLDSRAWCGKRANWWSPTTGRETVTVRCGQ